MQSSGRLSLIARSLDVAATGATVFTKVRLWAMHGSSVLAYKSRCVEMDRGARPRRRSPRPHVWPSRRSSSTTGTGRGSRAPGSGEDGEGLEVGTHSSSSALRSAWVEFDLAARGEDAALLAVGRSEFPRPWHRLSSITLQFGSRSGPWRLTLSSPPAGRQQRQSAASWEPEMTSGAGIWTFFFDGGWPDGTRRLRRL